MPFLPSARGLTWKQQAGQTTTTDPRSQRIRASRRDGQVLTRTQGPSNMNGLPDLRSLPDAPVPDGRTALTNRDARGRRGGHGSRTAPTAFHTGYQPDRALQP